MKKMPARSPVSVVYENKFRLHTRLFLKFRCEAVGVLGFPYLGFLY